MHKVKNLQPLQNMDDRVHFMDDKNQHQNRMLKLWRICDLQETNYILLSIFLAVINATHLRIRVDTLNDYIWYIHTSFLWILVIQYNYVSDIGLIIVLLIITLFVTGFIWGSTSLTDINNLDMTRGRETGWMATLLNKSG